MTDWCWLSGKGNIDELPIEVFPGGRLDILSGYAEGYLSGDMMFCRISPPNRCPLDVGRVKCLLGLATVNLCRGELTTLAPALNRAVENIYRISATVRRSSSGWSTVSTNSSRSGLQLPGLKFCAWSFTELSSRSAMKRLAR